MNENYCLLVFVLLPFAGAPLCLLFGKKREGSRNLAAELLAAMEFIAFLSLLIYFFAGNAGGRRQMYFSYPGFGLGMHLCLDGFRSLYCMLTSFMWLMATLFCRQYLAGERNQNRFYLFWLLTLGAVLGVFLSADLYTTFLFFEMMSFTSYVWVAQEETKQALRAAQTYLAVAVIGGLTMLMGLFLLYDMFGTLEISELGRRIISLRAANAMLENTAMSWPMSSAKLYVAGGCLLFGFGAKAGAFPLHIWLPKAHPVAPAPASALLSGLLTKTGIFGIIAITSSLFLYDIKWGATILLLGVATMFVGGILALFSIDLKRTLACSSVSQIGFIFTGIGMMVLLGTENGLAARGTLLHMMNHSLFKLTLFLAAGAVFMGTKSLDLNKIRGFGHGKPLLRAVFVTGALGIGGIPLFSGYISKTLLHESILEYRLLLREEKVSALAGDAWFSFFTGPVWMGIVEGMFILCGAMTVAYMLKLYVAIFWERNEDAKLQDAYDEMRDGFLTVKSKWALVVCAGPIFLLGIFPHRLAERAARLGEGFLGSSGLSEEVRFFSLANLKGGMISLLIGLAIYFVLMRPFLMVKQEKVRRYSDKWPAWLDLENLVYRPLLCKALPVALGVVCRIMERLPEMLIVLLRKTVYRDSKIPHEPEEGNQLTESVGGLLDGIAGIFHSKTNYRHKLALVYEDFSENSKIIGRSLSFGLFMACIGLILTLLYLLW